MALKEKIKFQLLVDPDDASTLILKPVKQVPVDPTVDAFEPKMKYVQGDLTQGGVYSVNIKNLKFEDGDVYSNKETFITKPDNYMFIDIEDVQEIVHGLNIPDESILKHIIEASKTAMYWAKKNVSDFDQNKLPDFNSPTFQEDYYPFYMFIKYSAMADAIREYDIEAVTGPKKWKDTLSDLSREEEMDYNGLKGLIGELEHIADEWLETIVTITADPKWALRGKYSYAIYNAYSNPYHKISWYKNDYNRGF